MKIKRFFAKDMRTALSQVKEELGSDAVIMSNKKVTGGVEIVAAVDTDSGNQPPPPSPARDELANRLGQAKRKLVDDKVQLKQSAGSRFASMLQNYQDHNEPAAESHTEEDSLSALLKRQSKHNNGGRDYGYDRDDSASRRREPQQHARQPMQSRNSGSNTYGGQANSGHANGGLGKRQPAKHALDIGDYQRPNSHSYDEKHDWNTNQRGSGYRGMQGSNTGSRSSNTMGERSNRLDPTRYDSKAPSRPEDIDAMRNEMASIRRLLEHQLSGLMWQEVERREPMRAMMIKRLEKMGLSPELSDQLACYIPEDVPAHEAWPALLGLLADQIITTDDCILETGGVVALLGPTGVGKTTTIAKLAARAAMDYGPEEIALVTTDTYRIGAHEQLSTYGRILGCPVRVAKDAEELADILHQLRHRRLVLLDTAGMGQRDIRLSEQLDTLMQNSGAQIRSLLVLPSTAQRRVLHETIEHFRRIPLSGCVLTKLDESLSLGEVMCVTIENALPIAYLADGQRVPEDIKVATGKFLVARANELLEQEISQQPHFWSSDNSENQAADFYD
ncbi:flagellar biosynthesis protein FlhF [Photobacterium swingsii]|uniref:Flagellar biosynthesis protein FlhF n=1 Tax=Photobacterium swingsii TaxID=680026 RepID=A0A0J8XWH6_9GAMM|nr:flagellar biosynthesis protein FlhF [Photobacterium swingsii]KMV29714.1 flagellar biosynthesis regulator FlhF [Photobacterium swingsii]PSW26586.1 flagellar biosynthesis protein FlhF [Photobacterium swingsii]